MPSVRLKDKDLLGRLVGFDTTSSLSNGPIADFVCEYLDRPGISVERLPGGEEDKFNVVAIAGEPNGPAKGLTLSGHLDVVPAGEPEWSSDPFKLTEREGTWVGRGACDMKASIALGMNLLLESGPKLTHPLALLLTCDEELGSLGAQHFVKTWSGERPLPASVIVGEPTSLQAVRMHKGHLTLRVIAHGKAAHSGSPHLGSNAVETAAKVIQALGRLGEVFKQKRTESSAYFPAVPFAVLNVGRIEGGSAINVVPERCVLDVGMRLLPGMNSQAAIEWARDAAVKADPRARIDVEVVNNNPPLLLDERAPIHEALCDVLGQTQSVGVSFASDAGPLAAVGMECVLFGPGSIEVAHRPNEFVPIDEFTRARDVLQRVIDQRCLS